MLFDIPTIRLTVYFFLECQYNISKEDMELYQECRKRYSELEMRSMFLKVGIAVAVILVILLLLLVYFLYRRRKQRKFKLKNSRLQNHVINGKLENDGLL